jgi:hypothetical protein
MEEIGKTSEFFPPTGTLLEELRGLRLAAAAARNAEVWHSKAIWNIMIL